MRTHLANCSDLHQLIDVLNEQIIVVFITKSIKIFGKQCEVTTEVLRTAKQPNSRIYNLRIE